MSVVHLLLQEFGSAYRCRAAVEFQRSKYHQAAILIVVKLLHYINPYPSTACCCRLMQVLFDAGSPAGVKAMFLSLYAPDLELACVLPHQVPISVQCFTAMSMKLAALSEIVACLLQRGPMDSSTRLAHRFLWADVVLNTLRLSLGDGQIQRSILCQSRGSDSDFSGGAGAWEHAVSMLQSASAAQPHLGNLMDLWPRSICAHA